MTNTQQTTAPTVVEGTYRTTTVERVIWSYNLPTGTEDVLIVADYRDVYDSRRDAKNIERGPVAIANLPQTIQKLSQRGFSNIRVQAA